MKPRLVKRHILRPTLALVQRRVAVAAVIAITAAALLVPATSAQAAIGCGGTADPNRVVLNFGQVHGEGYIFCTAQAGLIKTIVAVKCCMDSRVLADRSVICELATRCPQTNDLASGAVNLLKGCHDYWPKVTGEFQPRGIPVWYEAVPDTGTHSRYCT
jgi:hypothetical protein